MVKIAFHDNCLCERGTTVAVYDYAYYNKHYLGNESIIMYIGDDKRNVQSVVDKFANEFTLCPYNNWSEADDILKQQGCDIIYLQKAGEWDGKMSKVCKNIIHCVFNTQYKHGTVYGRISNCFGGDYPVVNYMVNLPKNITTSMRTILNIPNDAVVFGRHGGMDQFNIKYVHMTIDKITDENTNIYFIFVNTEKFCKDKSNIIHLDKIINLEKKVEFINSCDAMIHAREMGETFGSAVAEFSVCNKPVITCSNGYDLAHIDILKEKCFKYNDSETLMNVFNTIINGIQDIKNKDWNAYDDYSPEKIMDKFNEIFIQPCLTKIHQDKTIGAKTRNGGPWDNLWKPGHLHGIWLTTNKNRQNNKKINQCVDIGSGTGWFVNYIVDEFNFERVIGIEPSETAIDIAKKINPKNYESNKVSYHVGFAEEQLSKVKLDRNAPTLFTTSIVLSRIEDDSVINILKEMNKIASSDSVFIFNENYDNDFHQNLWHCRTREWWKTQLPEWKIIFDERPRPDLNNQWKQGILGIKKESKIIDNNNTFLYYDYLPDLCDFCYDYPDEYYLKQGLKPKHRNIKWGPDDVKEGSVIFVKNLCIEKFFNLVYPYIKNKFFLINSRAGFDIDSKYKIYLNDNKIIKWIGTNIMWEHDKIFKVPIGFEENERCINGPASNNGAHEGGDQNSLRDAYKNRKSFEEKKNKLLLTWCGETHPVRKNINTELQKYDFVELAPKLKFHEYMNLVNDYKFVLCPRGTGEDTHRFWETLLCNSIPIVKKSGLQDFHNKFPCIIVDNFSDINMDLLNNFKLDENKYKNIDNYLLIKNITQSIKNELKYNK